MTHGDIEQIIRNLLSSAGYVCDDVEHQKDPILETIVLNIKTPDARHLIGRDGDVARALSHLVHRLVENKLTPEIQKPKFSIDIDGYYAKKIDLLKSKANVIADRVRSYKTSIAMDPMSSYERLIMHSHLAPMADIITESTGIGPDRHIVVKFEESTVV